MYGTPNLSPYGLRNASSVFQAALVQASTTSKLVVPHDHYSEDDGESSSCMIAHLDLLPYQEGASLTPIEEEEEPTENATSSSGQYSPERQLLVVIDNTEEEDDLDRHHPRNQHQANSDGLSIFADESTNRAPQLESAEQAARRRAHNAKRAERRQHLAASRARLRGLPVINLEDTFNTITSMEINTPLAVVASLNLLARALHWTKYTETMINLMEKTYVLTDRDHPILSVPRLPSRQGSIHHDSRGLWNDNQQDHRPHWEQQLPPPPPLIGGERPCGNHSQVPSRPPQGGNGGQQQHHGGAGNNNNRLAQSHVPDLWTVINNSRDARNVINRIRDDREEDFDGFPAFSDHVRRTSFLKDRIERLEGGEWEPTKISSKKFGLYSKNHLTQIFLRLVKPK